MIAIILIGSLAVIVLTIAAIEVKTKQEAINCLNKTIFELHERNFELAMKLEEANEMLCDERDKVKRLEDTMKLNGSMIVQQRKDVVTLSGVTELYADVKPDIFDSDGKLTLLGRKQALRSVNEIVRHMYENPDEFDSFVHVTERISADDPGVFAVAAELNLVKV